MKMESNNAEFQIFRYLFYKYRQSIHYICEPYSVELLFRTHNAASFTALCLVIVCARVHKSAQKILCNNLIISIFKRDPSISQRAPCS